MRVHTLSGFECRFQALLLSIGMSFSFSATATQQLYRQVRHNALGKELCRNAQHTNWATTIVLIPSARRLGASPRRSLEENGEVMRRQDGVVQQDHPLPELPLSVLLAQDVLTLRGE